MIAQLPTVAEMSERLATWAERYRVPGRVQRVRRRRAAALHVRQPGGAPRRGWRPVSGVGVR